MFNKNNAKILELLGLIKEKQQEYAPALSCYKKAWKICNESNPSIGYRLAKCYLRDQKITLCINVCQKVLKQFPNYPKIEQEIYLKAVQQIRNSVSY